MSRPIIYLAITGHGFGHAVRLSSIAAEIQQLCPDVLLIVVTTAPRWLLESYITGKFIHRPRAFDVGVIQSDSLTMDKSATLTKMQHLYTQQQAIINAEVDFIRTHQVNLILGDIPALAAIIGKKANVPCWMVGNFGWDFIYQDWGEEFAEIVRWMQEGYSQCDRLFRLPLSEPMTIFPYITDTGLTGGTPRYGVSQLRDKFNITTPIEKTILLTFGGLGLQSIPYHRLSSFPNWQFITFDRNAPNLPNLYKITDNFFRPVDFMPLVGRVISKPGFSTFSEAMRLDVPIVSLIRDDFAEGKILLNGLQDYAYHQILTPTDFFEGDWQFLREPLIAPRLNQSINTKGTEEIAQTVVDFLT